MFLLEITQKTEAKTLVDNDRYRIIGMPFYNEQHTRAGFIEELRTIDKA